MEAGAKLGQRRDELFRRELTGLIPHLRAFARTLCGDAAAADDLAQDAMLKAWSARSRLRDGHQHEGLDLHDPAQPVLFREAPFLASDPA